MPREAEETSKAAHETKGGTNCGAKGDSPSIAHCPKQIQEKKEEEEDDDRPEDDAEDHPEDEDTPGRRCPQQKPPDARGYP